MTDVYPVDDTHRCRECEALIAQEWDLCEDCHSDWIGWLMERDMQRAIEEEEVNTAILMSLQQEGKSLAEAMQAMILSSYGFDRTPGTDASRPDQLSGWLPDTDDPEGTPF